MTISIRHQAMLEKQGGTETLTDEIYVVFEPWADIRAFNDTCLPPKLQDRYLVFASDGGGEMYALDLQGVDHPVVMLPLIGTDGADAIPVADNLDDLFEKLGTRLNHPLLPARGRVVALP